ncbi:protein GLUTAMINE DUMPER 3 [Ricinus communis]|uniref:Uncharacterized protein n=1 Tax=Ricinus communis TaxID=3988 RepID=B9RNR2_RICCO|nr:protein GLUTAMINE DUMPER 3 [Ricinus communis]EEF46830.1 conserved hypothetical protein [Ricinus communis]|eukprot:XP_002515381.1 protein GLUTAMINE DUMPER 3 [Ricinus communis]
MRPIRILINAAATTEATLSPPLISQPQRSPWHSPVPYLFGGLAAMLGLIAFALLILACSYWRLSGRVDNREGSHGGDDLENGNEKEGGANKAAGNDKVYEEKILVIMAGDQKPTFLATPVSSRAPSFGDKSSKIEKTESKKTENEGKTKGGVGNLDQTTTTATATAETEGENEENRQAQEQSP